MGLNSLSLKNLPEPIMMSVHKVMYITESDNVLDYIIFKI